MKINLKYTCILLLSLLVVSCDLDEFLDRAPDQNLGEDKVFTVFANAEKFHLDIYSNLRARFNVAGSYQPAPMSSASDESDSQYGYQATTKFNVGNYDGEDPSIDVNYEGIRKANLFLSKKEVIPFPNDAKKNQLLGETYFLRAFFFNEVVKRFGGMPILDETKMLVPGDNLSLPRNSYKDCVEFILGDLEKAITLLPATVSETEYGRATKGAAMALKARVLLFAASPLWQKEMGTNLWKDAADAAKAVIDLKDEQGALVYELFDRGNGADDYEQLFFTRREGGNKEVIFAKHAGPVKFSDDEISVWAPKGGNLGGVGSVCPTQNFVNLFEMKDGKSIKESSLYNAQDPFKNRDPRFYKTVLYNGSQWQGETLDLVYNENRDLSGDYRKDKSYTRTGYYVRKYLPEQVKNLTSNTAYHNWIYFRLAEMYLNYAEALNESADTQEARTLAAAAVNKVRARSGMPNLPISLTQVQLKERIWNERAIELSFEEHRWWDARRWLKAVDWFGGAMYEMEITRNNQGALVYEEKPFFNRVYRSYMNLYPIPLGEIQKNPLYVQNPGW